MTVTKTIGTSSRDYSTITLWEADLDNGAVYSSGDDAVGVCYDDSAFDEAVTINGGGTVGLNSVTLTVAESDKHDGTAGTGARFVRTGTVTSLILAVSGAVCEWLEFDINEQITQTGLNVNATDTHYRNIILHGLRYNTNNVAGGVSISSFGSATPTRTVSNSIVYDIQNTASGSSAAAYGISQSPNSRRSDVYNCTVHDVTNADATAQANCYVAGGVSTTPIKNCIGTDSTDAVFSAVGSNDTYNASSDATATGTGSIASITTADQYVSTVVGSEDLHLKANSDCIRAGTDLATTPTGVNIDINGYDRDAGGKTWDIGAHQWLRTVTKTIGTTGRDYSTITLWEADIDDTSIYSTGDDVIGECYDDSVFAELVTFDGGTTLGLDSVRLTVAETDRHDGTAGTGARIVTSSFGALLVASRNDITFEWLELDGNGARHDTLVNMGAIAQSGVIARNLIVHNGWQWSGGGAIYTAGYTNVRTILNCIVYDWQSRVSNNDSGGIVSRSAYGVATIQNCTVHDITSYDTPASQTGYGIAAPDHSSVTLQNNIVTDCEDSDFRVTSYSSTTCDHNMSSDTSSSGTGSVDSVVTADQFVSTVGGSEDLHLKAGSGAIDAGTDLGTSPTGVNIDIDGRDRDAEGDTWDIGAHEYVVVSTTNVKKFNGVAYANIKKINGVAIANIKKINGIA